MRGRLANSRSDFDLVINTPDRRRAISADPGALTQFSKTEDLGMPADLNLRATLY
jgi:hypothetical protein